AIEIAGVEQRDTGIDCGTNCCNALVFVDRPIGARRHPHAAEPPLAHQRPGFSQSDSLHRVTLQQRCHEPAASSFRESARPDKAAMPPSAQLAELPPWHPRYIQSYIAMSALQP